MREVIHIFGASGSGTSTLGKYISDKLGYYFMDTDDYFWLPTEPKYTQKRELNDRIHLMTEDLDQHEHVILSGSLAGWGDGFIPRFTFAIRVVTDADVRAARLRQREYERFGARVLPGGDMYEQHLAFYEWAAEYDTGDINMRSKKCHDEWQKRLLCNLVQVNGEEDLEKNYDLIKQVLEQKKE